MFLNRSSKSAPRNSARRVVPWNLIVRSPVASDYVPSAYVPQFGKTIEESRESLPPKEFGEFLRLPDSGGALLVVQNPYQSMQDEVGRISGALRNRDFEPALTLSNAALERQPVNYRIWTLRGISMAGKGDLPAALLAYKHALKISPNYLPALEGVAQSEFQLGRNEAEPSLLRVLAQIPEDPVSNDMLAVLEFRKDHCADAVNHFEKAASIIASQPTPLSEYGWCLAMLRRRLVSIF